MRQAKNQPTSSQIEAELAAQVRFAKDHVAKGYKIIATALSWAGANILEDVLRARGVEAEGYAMNHLSRRKGLLDEDTVVVWDGRDPSAQEQALMDAIEQNIQTSSANAQVYFVSGSHYRKIMTYAMLSSADLEENTDDPAAANPRTGPRF